MSELNEPKDSINGGILLFKTRQMAVLPFSLKRKILRYMHQISYLSSFRFAILKN
jgi:hypothetical protein